MKSYSFKFIIILLMLYWQSKKAANVKVKITTTISNQLSSALGNTCAALSWKIRFISIDDFIFKDDL